MRCKSPTLPFKPVHSTVVTTVCVNYINETVFSILPLRFTKAIPVTVTTYGDYFHEV